MARRTWTLETVWRLKRELPAAFPVKVRSCAKLDPKDYGFTSLEGKGQNRYFLIRINQRLPDEWARESLIHEWAHARAWSLRHEQLDQSFESWHDHHFGVAYAEAYCAANKTDEHYE
jgi:hypothetical protein